jgi:hypothetical protein
VTELRTIYSRIKEKYFGGNYVPHPDLVSFSWKKGRLTHGGTCYKQIKRIKIGKIYSYAFELKTRDPERGINWCTDNFNEESRKGLIMLMIHEMIHLRLPHHRKSFKQKEKEICGLVRDEHMLDLYDGLIRSNHVGEAPSKQGVTSVPQEGQGNG